MHTRCSLLRPAFFVATALFSAACAQAVGPGYDAAPFDGGIYPDAPISDRPAPVDVQRDVVIFEAAPPVDVVDIFDVQTDVPPDAPGFVPAPHEPFPQVPLQGGPRISHLYLVGVTYADDINRPTLEAFDRFVVGSSWLNAVGSDYGVGAGTLVQNVELAERAPLNITSGQIESMLATRVQNGMLPRPPMDAFDRVIYLVYFPRSTHITLDADGQTSQSCVDFAGYHKDVDQAGLHFAYAAVPTCNLMSPGLTQVETMEEAASHEIIEAATDAFPLSNPGYQLDQMDLSPWLLLGGEVADLCAGEEFREGGFVVQRSWSNTAARAGGDPCVPVPAGVPYFNVSPSPADFQTANAGDTVTFILTGWSTAPVADWMLQTNVTGTFNPSVALSTHTMNNGRTATLTVRIPPGTPSNSYAGIMLYSGHSLADYRVWPVGIFVN